jgi:hypothetical protein
VDADRSRTDRSALADGLFRRQVGRGSLRRLSKTDRSIPIVTKTEQIPIVKILL